MQNKRRCCDAPEGARRGRAVGYVKGSRGGLVSSCPKGRVVDMSLALASAQRTHAWPPREAAEPWQRAAPARVQVHNRMLLCNVLISAQAPAPPAGRPDLHTRLATGSESDSESGTGARAVSVRVGSCEATPSASAAVWRRRRRRQPRRGRGERCADREAEGSGGAWRARALRNLRNRRAGSRRAGSRSTVSASFCASEPLPSWPSTLAALQVLLKRSRMTSWSMVVPIER